MTDSPTSVCQACGAGSKRTCAPLLRPRRLLAYVGLALYAGMLVPVARNIWEITVVHRNDLIALISCVILAGMLFVGALLLKIVLRRVGGPGACGRCGRVGAER